MLSNAVPSPRSSALPKDKQVLPSLFDMHNLVPRTAARHLKLIATVEKVSYNNKRQSIEIVRPKTWADGTMIGV